MLRFFATAFLVFCSCFVFAFNAVPILRLVETGDYEKARLLLAKVAVDEQMNPAYHYCLAHYYAKSDHSNHSLEKAASACLLASTQLGAIHDSKQLEKYRKMQLRPLNIEFLHLAIQREAWERANDTQSVSAFNYFIHHFQDSSLVARAIARRNELAFESAKYNYDFQSFKDFLDKYPDAKEAGEAYQIYEYLLYMKFAKDSSWQSFQSYAIQYPLSPYAKDAEYHFERLAYRDLTKDRSLESYVRFCDMFPENPFVPLAEDSIYLKSTPSLSLSELEAFIKRFPKNRRSEQAMQMYCMERTADGDSSSYYNLLHSDLPLSMALKEKLQAYMAQSKRQYLVLETELGPMLVDTLHKDSLVKAGQVESIVGFSNELAILEKDGRYYYYDKIPNGFLEIQEKFSEANPFQNGYAVVGQCDAQDNCKYGMIMRNGQYLIPAEWDDLYDFTEGLALAGINGKGYGYINRRNQLVFGIQFKDAWPFSEGLAAVLLNNDSIWRYVNQEGKVILHTHSMYAYPFSDSLALQSRNDSSYYYINHKGEDVFGMRFLDASSFENGKAIVSKSEKVKNKTVVKQYWINTKGILTEIKTEGIGEIKKKKKK